MAYGDYHGPNKEDKGLEGGSCNRTLCQAPDAIWWNHGSYSWYCKECRFDIENNPFNIQQWRNIGFDYPMFETREMMNERKGTQ